MLALDREIGAHLRFEDVVGKCLPRFQRLGASRQVKLAVKTIK
jgi:hypothetical protein